MPHKAVTIDDLTRVLRHLKACPTENEADSGAVERVSAWLTAEKRLRMARRDVRVARARESAERKRSEPTKTDTIIDRFARKRGAVLEEVAEEMGVEAKTVRSILSRAKTQRGMAVKRDGHRFFVAA
jgi:hypothetical protein